MKKVTIRRIIREDVTIELLPHETFDQARERAIALQSELKWDTYDCEYFAEDPV